MKKLYGFLIMLMALGVITSETAFAQNSILSYFVNKIDVPDAQGLGSGPNWSPISGGINAGLVPTYDGEQMSSAYQVPFNFTFVNQQITTSNTFRVNNYGTVVFSPTWPSSANYDYGSYDWFFLSEYGTVYDYIPYALYDNEIDYTYGYSYYGNYRLAPFEGYLEYNSASGYKVQYTILGSAPNRELVVETDNCPAYISGASPTLAGSWQTVVYEAGISTFQFNYGPQTGTFNTGGWGYYYNYGNGEIIESYGAYTAVKSTGGNYLTIGWNGNGTSGGVNQPLVSYENNYSQSGYYNSSAYGYVVEDNSQEPLLPVSSYKVFIAWPYDLAAGTITTPFNEDPYNINTAMTPTATLINAGSQQSSSCQVNFTISEFGVGQVYNQTITLSGGQIPPAFGQSTITFPSFTPNAYNIYEDTMIVYNLQPTADQNPSNNTMTDEWICSPPNDIKAVNVISPVNLSGTQVDVATPISVRFRNLGASGQTNVPVTATVHDHNGNVVFRDTVIIPNWPSGTKGGNSDGTQDYSTSGQGPGKGSYYDTAFPATAAWVPSTLGLDTIFGIAIMGDDQLRADDTTKSLTDILPEYDAAAIAVVNPAPGQEEAYNTSWPPAGLFQDVGVVDLFQMQIRAQIHRCSDGAIVFQADTVEEALNVDDGQVRFYFPTRSGPYNIASILPGCYDLCVIADDNNDINYVNDTACEQFSIIDRLKGDYYVGVGRQFQTIHQAIDTMKFRGIGANVRLILTDTAYHETGLTDASTAQGALDVRGINGLSDTSTVTWIPAPGNTPHIYVSGPQPFAWYMGDGFPGYMNWEGYNPSTVPTPDLAVAEPAKRGMIINSNMSAAGAVFGIEEGASNVNMKDLVIHGNGMFAADSDAVIRIFNDHSFFTFQNGIHDTIAMHLDNVNNCEIGNAKYGIYDHGYHDAFDPQQGVYRSWKNYENSFTRNTIGTAANPLSYAGIQFNGENGLVIAHNEISNINAGVIPNHGGNGQNVFGIVEPSMNTYIGPSAPGLNPVWPADTGNVTQSMINANRIRYLTSLSAGNTYGIAIQEGTWVYKSTGLTTVTSVLPVYTQNRIVNNMILDLYTGASGGVYPILMNTLSSSYSTDEDSVFNNSITTVNATHDITIQYAKHVFLWDNIIQNTGAGPYTNYWLEVPRPFASAISSDYNLFDLHGSSVFDSVTEYDVRYGTVFQSLYFRRVNDWRTYLNQDMHSLTGDPKFATPAMGTDSLHMPPALSYVESPAANTGEWLGTATQSKDFDGNGRLSQNGVVDIGAQEWDAFQYTNDLAVEEITQPGGFSQTSDTSVVTTESPLWITAVVRNLSSVGVYNVPVTAKVQRSVNGVWTTVGTYTSQPMTWQVNQSLNVAFQGPALTAANSTGVFQVTVSVPNDQNNVNNSQSKAFQILLKQNAVLLSYNGANSNGTQNRDSCILALNRLGVPFDTIDRNSPKGLPTNTIIDYTPWWTIVWAMGDPGVAPNPNASPYQPGQGGLTLQETDEITRYLGAGLSYAKKSLVIAGQSIAWYNGFLMSNNAVTDTAWLQSTMHTVFYARSPLSESSYSGSILGQQPAYWTYADYLSIPANTNNCEECSTPNLDAYLYPSVVLPDLITPAVGPTVNGYAYTYGIHPATPNDSGAGISFYNPLINTVFYGFDWANPYQVPPQDTLQNDLTSGTTRTLAAAFAFFRGHQGTVLPVDFVDASASCGSGHDQRAYQVGCRRSEGRSYV